MKSNKKGLKKILKAFSYSFNGFLSAFKSEEALRLDVLFIIIFSILALFLPATIFAKSILISSLILILFAELLNTSIEVIIDRISGEYHALSKKAKDIGSCLVLLAFINAGVIWFAVLYEITQV